jgi:rRNA processing protein Gar1
MDKKAETGVVAKPGSILEIHAHRIGESAQLGEILEVLGDPDHPHFRVRWEDGRESIFYPSDDARVRPKEDARSARR